MAGQARFGPLDKALVAVVEEPGVPRQQLFEEVLALNNVFCLQIHFAVALVVRRASLALLVGIVRRRWRVTACDEPGQAGLYNEVPFVLCRVANGSRAAIFPSFTQVAQALEILAVIVDRDGDFIAAAAFAAA